MTRERNPANGVSIYTIRVDGWMDDRWARVFDGFSVSQDPDGTSRLTGPVADQAALHAVIKRIRSLGMVLISINPGKEGQE